MSYPAQAEGWVNRITLGQCGPWSYGNENILHNSLNLQNWSLILRWQWVSYTICPLPPFLWVAYSQSILSPTDRMIGRDSCFPIAFSMILNNLFIHSPVREPYLPSWRKSGFMPSPRACMQSEHKGILPEILTHLANVTFYADKHDTTPIPPFTYKPNYTCLTSWKHLSKLL